MHRHSRHVAGTAVLAVLTFSACHGDGANGSAAVGGPEPVAPLASSGRWFTDATGRVVMLYGFNEVAKSPPFHPAAFGFGDDDAAFLAGEGFNALRLGVDLRGLMPAWPERKACSPSASRRPSAIRRRRW
jgi:hypothetical protein